MFAVQALNLAAFHSEVDGSSVDGMMHTLVWGKLKAKKVLAYLKEPLVYIVVQNREGKLVLTGLDALRAGIRQSLPPSEYGPGDALDLVR